LLGSCTRVWRALFCLPHDVSLLTRLTPHRRRFDVRMDGFFFVCTYSRSGCCFRAT
jgi:hypothetical protein